MRRFLSPIYLLLLLPMISTAGQMQVCRDQNGLISFSDRGCDPDSQIIATEELPRAESVISGAGLRPGEVKMLQDLEEAAAIRLEEKRQRAIQARQARAHDREVQRLEDELEQQRLLNQRLSRSRYWSRFPRHPWQLGAQHRFPKTHRHGTPSGVDPHPRQPSHHPVSPSVKRPGPTQSYPPFWWRYHNPY